MGWILKALAATGVLGLFGITLDNTANSVIKAAVIGAVVYALIKKAKF